MNKSLTLLAVGVVLAAVFGYLGYSGDLFNSSSVSSGQPQPTPSPITELSQRMIEPGRAVASLDVNPTQAREMTNLPFTHQGELSDVSGGTATGSVRFLRTETQSDVLAEFYDLPFLEDGYFYEGWLVRSEPFDYISTGPVMYNRGKVMNAFSTKRDLSQYTQYVLTIEPDDGDPKPAGHVLEGELQPIE